MPNLTDDSRKSRRRSIAQISLTLEPLESRQLLSAQPLMSAVAAVKVPLISFPAATSKAADFGTLVSTLGRPTAATAVTPGNVSTVKETVAKVKVIVGPVKNPGGVATDDHDHGPDPIGYTPVTHQLFNPTGLLTAPRAGEAFSIASDYLRANATSFGLVAADFDDVYVTSQYTDDDTGITHIYFRQTKNDLDVINSDIGVHVMRDGRIITAAGGFVPGLSAANVPTTPTLTAVEALAGIADDLSLTSTSPIRSTTAARGVTSTQTFLAPGLSLDPVTAKLAYVPLANGGAALAWELVVRPDSNRWLDLAVDATTNEIIFLSNWVDAASYNVYALPKESPTDGGRTLAVDPQDLTASPFGWHDTNGVAGPDFTVTRGNNTNTYLDVDANDAADTAATSGSQAQADGTASLTFDYPIDLAAAPTTTNNQKSAMAQLFYANNVIHDVTYKYGFTDAAGNFQTNNYGRGGTGNDAVRAEAQDGEDTDNANFGTPAEGTAPTMQMFLWTGPTRDGDLDNGIIIHEYTHGISNRLTGGPANVNALNAAQSGAMGEGWGDWLALMMTQTASDTKNGSFPIGTYALGQSATGSGIRTYPYSYNMAVDPHTIGDWNSNNAVHYGGELWASTLWDMNWLLIDKYGYDSNLATGYVAGGTPAETAGNKLALRLVLDGMKLQPANPSFITARDAIISADVALTGGQNARQIWQAFARRGLGSSATTASSSSGSITQAFDLPTSLQAFVTNTTPATKTSSAYSSLTLTFSEPMVAASFSMANDVTSFTGPGATNLLPSITSSTWVDTKTLRINFAAQNTPGIYTLVVGPNILATDNNNPLDQNGNSTPGEAGDGYTAVIEVNPYIGPDSFGYRAALSSVSSPLLVSGTTGTSLTTLASTDDTAQAVPLGANTFNFYGTTYTANQLLAVTNGILNFTTAFTTNPNTDLSSSPTSATIAPLWDDWVTTVGATDLVLYALQDSDGNGTTDRLVVQWNDVRQFDTTANGVTFQAILTLNTGSVPGTIFFNYTDLNVGNASYSNGASSTTGIKDSGTQSAAVASRRLIINQNLGTSEFVQPGNVVRISTDFVAPTVTATSASLTGVTDTVSYTLSENVATSIGLSDLSILNTSTSAVFAPTAFSYNAGTNTVTYTLPALTAGAYVATLGTAGVTDIALNNLAAAGAVNFLYGSGADDYALSLDGAGNTLLRAGATTYSQATATLAGAAISAGSGDDLLTIDLVNGDPKPAVFGYDGGIGTDRVAIAGTAAAETVTVAGGTITYGATSFVPTTTEGVAANLAGGNDIVNRNAPATLSLTLALGTGADTFNQNTGAYTFATDAGLTTDDLTVNVASGASVTFGSTQHLAKLNLLAGSSATMSLGSNVLVVDDLTIAGGAVPTATLDLNDSDLIVNFTGLVGTKLSTLWSQILAGRGTFNNTTYIYNQNGLGIRSSQAAVANTAAHFGQFALGAIDNADLVSNAYSTFSGELIAGPALLVKYTYSGDANVDGKIDAADYARINASWATPPATPKWLEGDFNGDGTVDSLDYAAIDFGFLQQGPVIP